MYWRQSHDRAVVERSLISRQKKSNAGYSVAITVKTSGQRQGVNAISALSNTGGFWYRVYTERFNADVFIDCLKDLLKNRRRPVCIITDGHPVHKSKKVRDFVTGLAGRLSIFILPPYAPDLNPDELVGNYIRQTGTARMPLKKGESLFERTFIDLELIAQTRN